MNAQPKYLAAEYAETATRFEYCYNADTELFEGVAKNEHGKILHRTAWTFTNKFSAMAAARSEWKGATS